jgi:hypothetical protein
MKTLYSILIPITSLLSSAFAQAPAESWTLSQPESGNKNYVARESISLKPGFSYKATSGNTFNAKIDPTLLFPPTANTYAKADGSITDSPTEGTVVGNLSGVLDVSPTGAATYSLPIECPPGIQGLQPNSHWLTTASPEAGLPELRVNVGDDYNDKFTVGRKFWDQPNFEPMFTVVTNGNVGIGTSNPANKLDVKGIIRATEVKIETGWADFVFNDDYHLTPLSEVNNFIKENKHLPEIPSASEIEKNEGVNLGEMQLKLLQKIEELTLYLIQQENAIRELKSEIEQLKKQ